MDLQPPDRATRFSASQWWSFNRQVVSCLSQHHNGGPSTARSCHAFLSITVVDLQPRGRATRFSASQWWFFNRQIVPRVSQHHNGGSSTARSCHVFLSITVVDLQPPDRATRFSASQWWTFNRQIVPRVSQHHSGGPSTARSCHAFLSITVVDLQPPGRATPFSASTTLTNHHLPKLQPLLRSRVCFLATTFIGTLLYCNISGVSIESKNNSISVRKRESQCCVLVFLIKHIKIAKM